jgi:hypothetical protein
MGVTIDPTAEPVVDATVLLADFAQVVDSKLYLLGGGLTAIGPQPQPVAVAILLQIPWDRANIAHSWLLELLDEDGAPVPDADNPLTVGGNVETGRPVGARPGSPLQVPIVVNFTALPVQTPGTYLFRLSIDDATASGWTARLLVRPGQP